jgi:hypothetical protein
VEARKRNRIRIKEISHVFYQIPYGQGKRRSISH